MTKEAAKLGMYLDWNDPETDKDGVFGRDIAVDGFCEALVRYGEPGTVRFFRNSQVLNPRPSYSTQFLTNATSGVKPLFSEMRALKAHFNDHPFELWHDIDGNLQAAQDLRFRYSSRLYPITATPHVFSYATLGHNWALRMLLQPLQFCDSMICPTSSAKEAFSNLMQHIAESLARSHSMKLSFKPRLDIIPLGVDTEHFRPRDKISVRRKLNLPENATLLLWIGRLSSLDKADLLPLLRVFYDLWRDNNRLYLVIGGSGHPFVLKTLQDYAARLGLKKRLLFCDIPADIRHLYHSAADIFISPADSIQETFGITPIEAMASGVPQVVSDWDGYRDSVVEGKTGFLIPTIMGLDDISISHSAGVYDGYDMYDHFMMGQRTIIDTERLYQRLKTLIGDSELRQKMGEYSRKRALERYSWQTVIKSYENLWTELKQIAKNLPWQPDQTPDYEGARLSRIFGHYATKRTALAEHSFFLTDAGKRLIGEHGVLPAYHASVNNLSTDLLRKIIGLLKASSASYQELERKLNAESEDLNTAIYWLLKMGFVNLHASTAI